MPNTSNSGVDRRSFIVAAAGLASSSGVWSAANDSIPIIDAHIHLFDLNRPQGVPWSGPPDSPVSKKGAWTADYRKLTASMGVVGAIKVEASPWIEDNLWMLEVCAKDDLMVGAVGNLRLEKPEFPEYLERYSKNPLFRGVRYGNLWDYDIVGQSKNPLFIERLKMLAQADLVLDTANPEVDLLEAIVRISDAAPNLRIVVDHLPKLEPAADQRNAYAAVVRELGKRPSIYCKLSSVIHPIDGKLSTALSTHRARLDHLYETFGEDRVLFGSDWPNSDYVAPVQDVFRIVREYFASKSRVAAEKYFWKNSVKAYKWKPRSAAQRGLA